MASQHVEKVMFLVECILKVENRRELYLIMNLGAFDQNSSKRNVSIFEYESGFVITRILNGRDYKP